LHGTSRATGARAGRTGRDRRTHRRARAGSVHGRRIVPHPRNGATLLKSINPQILKSMKATLDHVGIAVKDLNAALAFYRDALGLEIEAPEDVASQRVRAHFIPVGASNLELLEATAPDSAIAKYVEKRGPGLHHITLRVDDVHAAVEQMKARGVRMIADTPRPGAEHSTIAFIHPSAAHGVLIELKQAAPSARHPGTKHSSEVRRFIVGDLELISVCDGFIRLDGGAMF